MSIKNRSMSGSRGFLALAIIASLLCGGLVSPVVIAQGTVLEEIVITARKRAETIQNVPLAVTAITTDLKEASVRRLDDLQSYAPNVYLRKTGRAPGAVAISIRGVSYAETDKSFDPNVGVIVDGMYMGANSGSLLNNFDIARVEILRGPQGTLHGKNTTGGVINVVRTPVTMEFGGNVGATLGTDGLQDFRAVVNTPLIEDTLGLKLFANSIESDGQFRNLTINEDVGSVDYLNYGFATRWEASDAFNLQLQYEKEENKSDAGVFANFNQPEDAACGLGFLFPGQSTCFSNDANSGMDTNSTNDRNRNDSTIDNAILTANWELGNYTVTSITALRDQDENFLLDFDASTAEFLTIDYVNFWEQFSQEIRISTEASDKLDFVAGLFYFDADYRQRWDIFHLFSVVAPFPPGIIGYAGQDQQTTSMAAFFSADYHVNDKLTFTLGGRLTREEKDFQGGSTIFYLPGVNPTPQPDDLVTIDYSDTWTEFTPKVGFSYQRNDDVMYYGSYSEGFKSGGFFGRQAEFSTFPGYEPEYLKAFELGMKSTLLDGRMIFNPTIFMNDYEDKQESILIPISLTNVATVVRNASNLDIFGIELELQYQITDAWNVKTTYGYLDTEYTGYNADLNGDGIVTNNDGLTPSNTPENTFGINTTYSMNVGEGELKTYISYRWRDELESIPSNDPLGTMDSISNLDATLSYIWNDGKYRISAFGRNITDEREVKVQRIGGLTSWGNWTEGSSYGVEFSADF